MTRRTATVLALLLAAPAALVLRPAGGEEPAPRPERTVTLLYTTDIHGHYLPHVSVDRPATDDDGVPEPKRSGGFAAIGAAVQKIRAETKNPVFVFDSGDVMTGHPVCDLEHEGALGGALFWMMNAVGYDAWCIGNHDFDHGRANASKITQLAKFPTLSANLKVEGEPALKVERWKVLEKDGVRVGVFGLMTENLHQVVGKDKIPGITVGSAADAAREAVAALASSCDIIVGLSHCGSDEDIRLVDKVPGIHVMLAGHNHKPLKPRIHGKTIVAEGDIKARRLGRLDVTVKNGEVVSHSGKLLVVEPREPEGDLKAALDFVREKLGKRLEEVIGKLERPWKREYYAESNIGNFFADALRESAKADAAFLNSGGIRTNVGEGDLTLEELTEVFPIENTLVTFEVTGKDLLGILEKNANAAAGQEYGVLQVSGVRYTWKRKGRKAQVLASECGGAPIDPAKTYRCVATDFVAVDQREKYLGVPVSKVEKLGAGMLKVAEAHVRAVAQKGPIRSAVDGRMREER